MINSGESFGLRSGGLLGSRVASHGAYLRDTIKDDFLNENDEDEEDAIRGSAESGELFNPGYKR